MVVGIEHLSALANAVAILGRGCKNFSFIAHWLNGERPGSSQVVSASKLATLIASTCHTLNENVIFRMNRKLLIRSTVLCGLLGTGFMAAAFVGSLRPSAQANASRPTIDVSDLKPGALQLRDHPALGQSYGGYKWSMLLLRHQDGRLRVWDVLTRDGKIAMPDIHWWRPSYDCEDFSLVNDPDGQGYLKCQDSTLPSDYWKSEWQWTLDGKAMGSSVDDMQPTVGTIEGRYFVLGKSD